MKLGSTVLATVFLVTFVQVSAGSTLNLLPSQESGFSPSNSPPIQRVFPEPMYILGIVNNIKAVLFDYGDTIIARCIAKSTSYTPSFFSTAGVMPLPWLSTSVPGMCWAAVLTAAFTLGALIGMTSTRLLLSKGYFYANDIAYYALFGRHCDDTVLTGVLITGASRPETYAADCSRAKSHSLWGTAGPTSFTSSFDEGLLPLSTPLSDESGLLRTFNKAAHSTKDHHSEAGHVFFHDIDTGLLDNVLVDHAVMHPVTKPPATFPAAQHMDASKPAELESARGVSTVASDQSIGDLALVESCACELGECELKESEFTLPTQVLGIPCGTGRLFDIENETSPVTLWTPSPANQTFNRLPAQSDEEHIVELFQLLSLDSPKHMGEARLPLSPVHATSHIFTHGPDTPQPR